LAHYMSRIAAFNRLKHHCRIVNKVERKQTMYIWQSQQWPHFSYQQALIQPRLEQVQALQHQLTGKANDLPADLDRQAEMDALIQNAIQTSEIEGEKLNVGSVRSSVARQLGLDQAGMPHVNFANSTRQTESLVAMLCDATTDLEQSIHQQRLCEMQAALFPEPPLSRHINVGELRADAPMQVVSQQGRREVVHFEAPPRQQLEQELAAFIDWFNKSALEANVLRAAIAHLWLITLHPFDDGNGRVARALTDRALAQAEDTSVRFYSLSAAIEANRNDYYNILENTQSLKTASQAKSETDITDWLMWFLEVLSQAMQQGIHRIDRVVAKARFWQIHSQTVLTERQVKVLNRLLDSTGEEFTAGINASKYKSLADVSKATATRDLAELVNKACLKQLPGGGRSTRYAIATV